MADMTHEELVEKVARVLWDGLGCNFTYDEAKAMKHPQADWMTSDAIAAVSTIAQALKEPTEAMERDPEGYELRHYKVVYYVELGWIGDSEGRTWAKELKESTPFPTMEAANAYADGHPDICREQYGWLRAKYDNGQAHIRRAEILLSAAEVHRAMLAASPLYPDKDTSHG